jgi:hypothetical protein
MSTIATFECYNRSWAAEQVYGDIPRHTDIAVAALTKRVPFCRKHLLSRDRSRDPFLAEFSKHLRENKFDLSVDFDTIIIQHDVAVDPIDEFDDFQKRGHQILDLIDDIPDFAYLEEVKVRGASGGFDRSYLTPSEIDDLAIARRSLTNMILTQHND